MSNEQNFLYRCHSDSMLQDGNISDSMLQDGSIPDSMLQYVFYKKRLVNMFSVILSKKKYSSYLKDKITIQTGQVGLSSKSD